jgi:AraC-like DNA-binding protein
MIYAPNSTRVPVSFKDVDQLSKSEKEYIRDDIIPTPALSPVVTFKEKEKALELFFEIISEHEKSHILPCKAKMTELIDMLLRDNFPQIFDPPSDNYIITQQIADYIDSGQGFGMKLEDFERQFSYDRFYLEKQFKKQFGIGLIAYKNKKRIQAATYLLKSNTVSQVARMLEFSSVYTFSRAFKSTTGLSPTEYKPK